MFGKGGDIKTPVSSTVNLPGLSLPKLPIIGVR
jgi:hypothetical protein